MTDEQIQNWRKALYGMIGPYALVVPKEEIEKLRDKMQKGADDMAEHLKNHPEEIDADQGDISSSMQP